MLKRLTTFVPIIVSGALLVGCGIFIPIVPKCSDSVTTDLVKQIAGEEMVRQVGKEIAERFSYKVGAIRTTSTNEQTGAHECAAQLQIAGNGQTNEFPITYTVEATDDGKEFYVTVFGL